MSEPVRLLIVDDERSVLISLTELLRYRLRRVVIETAGSAEEALSVMGTSAFDAVLSDMRMPKMNGLQLLREVKARWPRIQVFLMTGAEEQLRTQALEAGASGFFEKPLDLHALTRGLQEALRIRPDRQIQIRRDRPPGRPGSSGPSG